MARVKSTAARKHRKVLKSVKGFRQARRTRIQTAKEAALHAGQYTYNSRRILKRDLRGLWITRLSAAAKAEGMSYSKFMAGLKKAKIEIDRKILSEMAIKEPEAFKKIIAEIKK